VHTEEVPRQVERLKEQALQVEGLLREPLEAASLREPLKAESLQEEALKEGPQRTP
jgi:hypothetical protein